MNIELAMMLQKGSVSQKGNVEQGSKGIEREQAVLSGLLWL